MKTVVPVLSIISLVILEYTALSNGIDGTCLIVVSSLISGLGGYFARDILCKFLESLLAAFKEPKPPDSASA